MKIGYLVPEFPTQTHAFFWRELSAMEEAGAEIRLYSTRQPPASACPHAFREAAAARTRYLFPPDPRSVARVLASHPRRTAQALAYVNGLSETPRATRVRLFALIPSAADLVEACAADGVGHIHIHSCANAAHLGALSRILGGSSYSLTLHGDLPVYGTDHTAKFAQATFVSAVTRPLAATIAEISPGTHAPVIWMGVDTDRFAPPVPPRPRKGPDAPFELVTVARLNYTKGHVFALEAVARLRETGHRIRYRIAGEGPGRTAIEADISRLGLVDEVDLLGAISEDEVHALLGTADALALTSFGQGEAAPVVVMEAMARAVPVIASSIGGTPDMIDDGTTGFLVPQKDVGAITAVLDRLIMEPDLAVQVGQAARLAAIDLFDYRTNALKLLAEIRKAADQPVNSTAMSSTNRSSSR